MFEHLDDPVPPNGAARFDAVVHTARVRRRRRWAYAGSSGVVAAVAVLVSLLVIAPSHGQPSSLFVDEPSASPSTSATSPSVEPKTASPTPSLSQSPSPATYATATVTPAGPPVCSDAAFPGDTGRSYWDNGPACPASPAGPYSAYEKCEQIGPAGIADKPIPGLQISADSVDPSSVPSGGSASGAFTFTNNSTHPVYFAYEFGWSIIDQDGNGLSASPLMYEPFSGDGGGIRIFPLAPGEHQQQVSGAGPSWGLLAYGCGDSYDHRFPPLAPGDYQAVAWVGWIAYRDEAALRAHQEEGSGVWFTNPLPVTVTAASPSPSPSASPPDSPSPSPSSTGSPP